MNNYEKHAFEQIKQQYNMQFLKIGMNAIVNSKAVKVTGVSSGCLKGELINSQKKIIFHPTWETAFYNKEWEIIKDYRQNNDNIDMNKNFNEGWWNCFCSYTDNLCHNLNLPIAVDASDSQLTGAGVCKEEIEHVLKENVMSSDTRKILIDYKNKL